MESVKVTNGEFYLNKKGELCGYQTVTVSNVSKLLELANQGVNLGALSSEHGKWTEQIHKFARDNGQWFSLDGNKLTIRFYAEDLDETKEEMAKTIANGKPAFDGVAGYDEPFVTLTFGKKDATRTDFQADNLADGKYNTLVLDHISDRHEVIGMLNVARIRDKFFMPESVRESPD